MTGKKTNQENEGRQAGEFTEEEGRIHQAGFKVIHEGMSRGLGFDDACEGLKVVDPELRQVIVDDYLKVVIAEQHFQAGKTIEEVADLLRIPVTRVGTAKQEMLREVQQAAVDFYRNQAGEAGFDMKNIGDSDPDEREKH